jgi:hypothetical protein
MHAELACIGVVTRHGRTKLRTRAPQPTRGRYNRRLDMADSIAKWAMQVRAPGRETEVPNAYRIGMHWGGDAPRENKVTHARTLTYPGPLQSTLGHGR